MANLKTGKSRSCLRPKKLKRSVRTMTDYRYFTGHIVNEVRDQLPDQKVKCWYDNCVRDLRYCARSKFQEEQDYCARCSLFVRDKWAQIFRSIIEEWERDWVLDNPPEEVSDDVIEEGDLVEDSAPLFDYKDLLVGQRQVATSPSTKQKKDRTSRKRRVRRKK